MERVETVTIESLEYVCKDQGNDRELWIGGKSRGSPRSYVHS